MNRRTRLLSSLVFLAVLLGVPVLRTWRAVRQEKLDRALIAAIRKNDIQAVLLLLQQGADANARDIALDTRSFWRYCWIGCADDMSWPM